MGHEQAVAGERMQAAIDLRHAQRLTHVEQGTVYARHIDCCALVAGDCRHKGAALINSFFVYARLCRQSSADVFAQLSSRRTH